ETGALSFFQGVPITGLVMCTPVLLHVIVRLIISVRSRSLTLAVPRFSVPNQSSWYEDNATFERFLAGVFEIVADISVFVRFD
ncbi:MAG: hypothetical protein E7A39_09170, partial [Bifidobacterium longum]|nr:hypothetical protein [Bifidobacterium longum]MDU1390729.1 hypothetical protein [Bifidobacterium longum]